MKYSTIFVLLFSVIAVITGACQPQEQNNINSRNLSYEAYCDSIWENDPDYYLDVLVEGDEFQSYVELNGQWWED